MPLVLHGFTETDESWAGVLPEARCELLPGHGWRPCTQPDLPALAAEIAERLAPDRDLIGYSMGGRIALRTALDHPGRVRRLVLISSGPGFRDGSERQRRIGSDEALADILVEDGIGPFVAWWEANPILTPFRPFSRAEAARLRARRLSHDPLGLADALRRFGAGAMEGLWPRLGELRLPVLLVAGAGDARYLAVMGEMQRLIPGSRLHIVPESGHAIHRERPAPLTEAVRAFLAA